MKKITKIPSPNSKKAVTKPKPKRKFSILAIVGAIFLVIAIPIALYLLGQNSDNRNQAAGQQTSCVEQCPGKDGVLRNCTPPEADGSSQDSVCNQKGRVEICGGKKYICSGQGGKWEPVLTPKCIEQCPGKDGVLRNCTPPEADGSSQDSICNQKGRVESCGGKTYVCNKPSGKWTVVTPTPAPITCGWCGTGCGPIKKNQVCPMIAAPAGYACIPDKNQKTCVKVRVDIPIRR